MKKRITELQETIEQLKRSVDSIKTRMNDSNSHDYIQALIFAKSLYELDIATIETKIRLIKNKQI